MMSRYTKSNERSMEDASAVKNGVNRRGGASFRSNNLQLKPSNTESQKILVLHGNRQTGELLLGRMERLQKSILGESILGWRMIAPDAPLLYHGEDDFMMSNHDARANESQWQRTWWHREGNRYDGLETSLSMIQQLWKQHEFVSIIGFSQGSRLLHFIAILHTITNGIAFPGLKSVVHISGYADSSIPDNFATYLKDHWSDKLSPQILSKLNSCQEYIESIRIRLPSLHIMGEQDQLITEKSSLALMAFYEQSQSYKHPGGHHVPVKANDIKKFIEFFEKVKTEAFNVSKPKLNLENLTNSSNINPINNSRTHPNEENMQSQIDEVSALAQIFPTEFMLLSSSTLIDPNNGDPLDYSNENRIYQHPIRFSILLQPQDFADGQERLWPVKPISLGIKYPSNYPDISPDITLIHDMNYLEFSLLQSEALLNVIRKVHEEEKGMPCVIGMIYAAKDFIESGGLLPQSLEPCVDLSIGATTDLNQEMNTYENNAQVERCTVALKPSTTQRIKECNDQGLNLAYSILGILNSHDTSESFHYPRANAVLSMGKGGHWKYTIGLIGKPSAGKSTFFNAATGFARQKGGGVASFENNNETFVINDGAAMAPHPFTTIDPNIGYCLVPAPSGTCPEDDVNVVSLMSNGFVLGSSHGRDSKGRRLIPVFLKDVAGLVPGAYQGRGKGNKFLDDLTDADVLVHVVDGSGSSDTEGNIVSMTSSQSDANNPINDLKWVRNELVEWVYNNLSSKWDVIIRRGKSKLVEMFSGYKQSQVFVHTVFSVFEKYVKDIEGRDCVLDNLGSWDEGDLHCLLSLFLAVRFPMALALNKSDLGTSASYIKNILSMLPAFGALVGVQMSAYEEMKFMSRCIMLANERVNAVSQCDLDLCEDAKASNGVWDCLQAAMTLRPPILVFPVNNILTYEPLPGMLNYSTRDASLPDKGMIEYLCKIGGSVPSNWDDEKQIYSQTIAKKCMAPAIRDVLLMKPGSTVEDVFWRLKVLGAVEGEFIRAESASHIGEKPKLTPKTDLVGYHNRILRIMTTKRKVWQK